MARTHPSFFRQVSTLTIGVGIGQLALLAVYPIVSRLYSPMDFGILGLALSFLSVAVLVGTLRYEQAILSIPEEETQRLFTGITRRVPFLCAIAIILLVFICWMEVGGFGRLSRTHIIVLYVLLAVAAFSELSRYLLVRQKEFAVVASATVRGALSKAFLLLAFGAAGAGWVGLLAAELGGRLAFIHRGRRMIPWSQCFRKSRSTRSLLWRYREYPFIILPSSIIDNGADAAQLPIIAALHGLEFAGLYALVQRCAAIPSGLIARNVADVFQTRAVEIVSTETGSVSRLFNRTILALAGATVIPAAVVFLHGEGIFVLIFGETWREAGIIAALLSPAVFVQIVVSPVSRIVFVTNRLKVKLIFDLTQLGLIALLPIVSSALDWEGLETVKGLSLALIVSQVLYLMVLTRLARGCQIINSVRKGVM